MKEEYHDSGKDTDRGKEKNVREKKTELVADPLGTLTPCSQSPLYIFFHPTCTILPYLRL